MLDIGKVYSDFPLTAIHTEKGSVAFKFPDGTISTVLISKISTKYRITGSSIAALSLPFQDLLYRLRTIGR